MGFTTTKTMASSEYGHSWSCKKNHAGISYEVSVYSPDGDSVQSVTGTASIANAPNKKIIAVKPFLKTVGSVPFSGNDPAKVARWIDKNFYKDKKKLSVSGVNFQITASTRFVRMLRVSKGQ